MTADQFIEALEAEGIDADEYDDWRSHNRNHKGPWGPMNGVVIHHTADDDSLDYCYTGDDELPGPLCHSHLAKDGTITMIGNGRANHAGTFAANAHQAVVDESEDHPDPDRGEPVDGNAHYYGIEIENEGDGEDPYPAEQYEAAVKWAAAICRFHGWTENSVIGHGEGTRRKVDPSFDMDQFRKDVAAQLGRKPSDPTPSKPDYPPFPGADFFGPGEENKYVTMLGKRLIEKGYRRFYSVGAGPQWTGADKAATRAFQLAQGWSGGDADGYPGPVTWKRLFS
ncbi:peptidoglycan-binding protein [Streptomyces sp. NPDC053048]|uniref:peptidoglycan-binding protein n=1 Tax=Streptomyces sp. NPDC053048 TaxID=3365694 RepID=UPI0037D65158